MTSLTPEARVDAFNDQLSHLTKGLTGTVEQQKKMGKKSNALKENVESALKSEPFVGLEVALRAVHQALAQIEREREKAVTTRMQGSVLGKLNEMDNLLKKPINVVAKDLKKRKKTLISLNKKTTVNETAVQDARKACVDQEKALYQELPAFEEKRVEDVKTLLTEYCNSLLYYHCKSVEQLTNALSALGKVDSTKARKSMDKEIKKAKGRNVL
mgnify:FL=1|tara:strand:+ start:64 stop:705 length:642 start_codon:yes stop_codon:yes gene_type:complete